MPKFTLTKKCDIVEEAIRTGKIRETARNYNAYPSQIRRGRVNYNETKSVAEQSPKKQTVHSVKQVAYQALEDELYDRVKDQRASELCVTTQDIIDKAISICPTSKNGDSKKQHYWVYQFINRRELSIRTSNSVVQVLNTEMQSVRQEYCSQLMRTYLHCINNPRYLVNMDQTTIYLNYSPNRTFHEKGKRTISIRVGGSSSMRFTLCMSVAMDGKKLPLFVIFKGEPNGNIGKDLRSIMPAGMLGCTQNKAWCDERAMLKWYDSVWNPYIADYDGESGLLLAIYKVHTMESLMECMTNDKSKRFLIPGNCTSVLQPCDVGMHKPLKERLKKAASD